MDDSALFHVTAALAALLSLVVVFQALVALQFARMIRRGREREAEWERIADDLSDCVATWRRSSESWKQVVEAYRDLNLLGASTAEQSRSGE